MIPAQAPRRLQHPLQRRAHGEALGRWLESRCAAIGGALRARRPSVSGEAFLTPPGRLSELICERGRASHRPAPELSTSGGTSDARFIKDHCPVAEFGLVGQTMHKVDENAPVADISALTGIYHAVLDGFFARER